MVAKNSKQKKSNTLRIIGGRWRGRVLEFPDSPGLRPTGDRVRETVFNWLQVEIPGSRCLDLYAGSGALGFEALSRGASEVVMVERSPKVVAALKTAAAKLDTSDSLQIKPQSALDFIAQNERCFDVIFLDPPFESDLHHLTLEALKKSRWFVKGCVLYIECPSDFNVKELLDPRWEVLKEKSAGQVSFLLLRV